MTRAGSLREEARSVERGARFGQYELLARIADGGMGSVWVARAPGPRGLTRCVAIKVPHARDDEDALVDEARIGRAIAHPHVVRVLDLVADASGAHALVMELVEGASLRELAAAEALPPRIALRVVHDALLGLHAAHEARGEHGQPLELVHCDVSPANVLVRIDGHALVTDFGVARTADRAPRTPPGRVKGKVGYLAPEQIRSARVDRRVDVYAMGVVLWELLAARRLFDGGLAALLHEPEREAPPIATVVPAMVAMQGTLARALARDPDARFATARALAVAIEQAAPAIGGLATRLEVARHVRRVAGEGLERTRWKVVSTIERRADVVTREVAPEPTGKRATGDHDATRRARPERGPMGTSGVRARVRLEEASTELAQPAGDPTRAEGAPLVVAAPRAQWAAITALARRVVRALRRLLFAR